MSRDAPRPATRLHASCAARDGAGVLLVGAPGSGKSDLLLRLLDRGFGLVADDQVDVEGSRAQAPAPLAGLLEIRGLGLVRMPYIEWTRLALVVRLERADRLPHPAHDPDLDLPMISLDPWPASAAQRVELALDAVQGRRVFVAGAFD